MNQVPPTMNIAKIGTGTIQIIWAHGWSMDNNAFAPFAQTFTGMATSYLPDLAGHGKTPEPPAPWTTREYADALAAWLQTLPPATKRIWVGHSFGCRVGLQLAAHHKGLFNGMVLVGPAGLKRNRPLTQKIWFWAKVYAFKTLKIFVPEGPARDKLRARFGSADYKRASGTMRRVLINAVNEDLGPEAEMVTCPTVLVCGSHDTETPPEISRRLQQKIKGAELHILDGYDHYTILTAGRHQVAALVKSLMDKPA
ncbi:MAG: alpha/beta hydrolase [Alphaproteobacteria bacterium]|nr:alpha/beta hydrolase [Alphaproteobacteria bacterium]